MVQTAEIILSCCPFKTECMDPICVHLSIQAQAEVKEILKTLLNEWQLWVCSLFSFLHWIKIILRHTQELISEIEMLVSYWIHCSHLYGTGSYSGIVLNTQPYLLQVLKLPPQEVLWQLLRQWHQKLIGSRLLHHRCDLLCFRDETVRLRNAHQYKILAIDNLYFALYHTQIYCILSERTMTATRSFGYINNEIRLNHSS